jgi:hypothetical protein
MSTLGNDTPQNDLNQLDSINMIQNTFETSPDTPENTLINIET